MGGPVEVRIGFHGCRHLSHVTVMRTCSGREYVHLCRGNGPIVGRKKILIGLNQHRGPDFMNIFASPRQNSAKLFNFFILRNCFS